MRDRANATPCPSPPRSLSAAAAPLGNPTVCTALTKPQTHDLSQVPPPVGPAAQPTACQLQVPSQQNHKSSAESQEEAGGMRSSQETSGSAVLSFLLLLFVSLTFSPCYFASFTRRPLPKQKRQSGPRRAAPSSPSKQDNTRPLC